MPPESPCWDVPNASPRCAEPTRGWPVAVGPMPLSRIRGTAAPPTSAKSPQTGRKTSRAWPGTDRTDSFGKLTPRDTWQIQNISAKTNFSPHSPQFVESEALPPPSRQKRQKPWPWPFSGRLLFCCSMIRGTHDGDSCSRAKVQPREPFSNTLFFMTLSDKPKHRRSFFRSFTRPGTAVALGESSAREKFQNSIKGEPPC